MTDDDRPEPPSLFTDEDPDTGECAHHPRGERSRRWILVHMVEETARHNGHADILREQLDGVTGE